MNESQIRNAMITSGVNVQDLLTPEDKSNIKTFAQKIHNMNTADVARLHNGTADILNPDQKDIVAFEIKLREYKILKDRGINPKVDFAPENLRREVELDPEDPKSVQWAQYERMNMSGMTDDLLERSRNIIENTYIPVETKKLHEKDGGGVNMMFKKYVAVDDNGNKVKVNNEMVQERFRKNYLKTLSDITGIDYTVIDEDFYNNFEPEDMIAPPSGTQIDNKVIFDKPNRVDQIDIDDYEDD